MSCGVTGLTNKSFMPSLLSAADCFLGPVIFEFVTEVDAFAKPLNVSNHLGGECPCVIILCPNDEWVMRDVYLRRESDGGVLLLVSALGRGTRQGAVRKSKRGETRFEEKAPCALIVPPGGM